MACLDPREIARVDTNISRLKYILHRLVEAKRPDEDSCDDVIRQYRLYIREVVVSRKAELSEFEYSKPECRVDSLFTETMAGNTRLEKLWNIVKTLLLLSHGNASVERSFSTA